MVKMIHQVYGTELKNVIMKRFIQKIKDRTEYFTDDDHFPCAEQVVIDNSILPIRLKCLFCI